MHGASTQCGRVLSIYILICANSARQSLDFPANVRTGSTMNDREFLRKIAKPRRKRLDQTSDGSRSSERSNKSTEPARPPRTKTHSANVTATHISDPGNGQHNAFVESEQRPS